MLTYAEIYTGDFTTSNLQGAASVNCVQQTEIERAADSVKRNTESDINEKKPLLLLEKKALSAQDNIIESLHRHKRLDRLLRVTCSEFLRAITAGSDGRRHDGELGHPVRLQGTPDW